MAFSAPARPPWEPSAGRVRHLQRSGPGNRAARALRRPDVSRGPGSSGTGHRACRSSSSRAGSTTLMSSTMRLKPFSMFVRVDDREAVGGFGERAQRRASREQARVLLDSATSVGFEAAADADAGRRHNRLVEHGQPARIDRVERRVRAVRLVEDRPDALLVVELREHVAIALAVAHACRLSCSACPWSSACRSADRR